MKQKMTNPTMRNAFLSAIDYLCMLSGQSQEETRDKVIVNGPNGEMLSVSRDEFMMDDAGIEIGNEFVIGWTGIERIEVDDGVMKVTLTDGKTVNIESCP